MLLADASLTPATLWSAWSAEPGIIVPLALSIVWYAAGVARLWRHAGAGHGIRPWQAWCGAAGWITLALALVSPLHELGETLFAAHMVQHEVMMVIAAPLLVLGRPLVAAIWALPARWRRATGRFMHARPIAAPVALLQLPLVAWSLQALALWLWHVPAWYDAAVTNDTVHAAQHLSFLGSALLFWWVLIERSRGRAARGRALVSLITTAAHTGALGALLTFATVPLYPAYGHTATWGLTALEDQQLAGLIMWIPAGIVYLVAILIVMASWVGTAEAQAPWPAASAA